MDPISDMFTRIRNSLMAKKEFVIVPYSKFRLEIAKFLQRHGFIKEIKKRGKKTKKIIKLIFFAEEEKQKIHSLSKVSKPSKRIYAGYRNLKPYRSGAGMYILSTPKGIISDKEAKKLKVGGEVIGKIY